MEAVAILGHRKSEWVEVSVAGGWDIRVCDSTGSDGVGDQTYHIG